MLHQPRAPLSVLHQPRPSLPEIILKGAAPQRSVLLTSRAPLQKDGN